MSGVGGAGSKQRGAGARYLPPNLAQASSGTLQWDRRQIRMWKPRLTLLVLEAPAKKSFLEDSGKVTALPSQRISKEVSWVSTFQERSYWEQGACLQREPAGVVWSLGLWALLPSPVITWVRPWEHLCETLAAIHPMPLPSPSRARRESSCNRGWLSLEPALMPLPGSFPGVSGAVFWFSYEA